MLRSSRFYSRIKIGLLLVAAVAASFLRSSSAVPAAAASTASVLTGRCTFDHARLDAVLRKFVKPPQTVEGINSTLFDYKAILASSSSLAKLHDYVASLRDFQPSCLSADGKLAFWANAYNALIINMVLGHAKKNGGPLPKSIKDLKGSAASVWNREAGVVAGKARTLEEVLSEASSLGDPRIHAAVNCASLSCPDLRAGAYSGEHVQAQLDAQVRKWLHNLSKGVKANGDHLLVSHIFEWHAEDFLHPSLEKFLAGPLELASSSLKVTGYLPYNWNLNKAE